jgi:hypothetical protein
MGDPHPSTRFSWRSMFRAMTNAERQRQRREWNPNCYRDLKRRERAATMAAAVALSGEAGVHEAGPPAPAGPRRRVGVM